MIKKWIAKLRIPHGDYCYKIVGISPDKIHGAVIKVKSCPYYKYKNSKPYCKFLNQSDDLLLDDQCKICNINVGDEDYENVV
jgi:hypothetical protein